MALASRTGGPSSGVGPIIPEDPIMREERILDHQQYIKDTFVNKTSFNPETYAEEFKLLQRYTAGSRIAVTYFLNSTPTAGLQRATTIDPSSVRSPVQTSYTEIKNFEMVVLDRGLQSEFNPDSRETKITGSALLYPGMKPRAGDLFITPIGDAMYGVFQVMDVTRLTYRQGANHKIVFFLREYATDDGVNNIRQSVTTTLWFDTETYLGDATTLLEEKSYINLQTLRKIRPVLIRHYYNTFYDRRYGSIFSPEGVFDPYLVQYLIGKISILDSNVRPLQLYPGLLNYENSIWARLTEVTNRTLIGLQGNYNLAKYRASRWDVAITSLVNRILITLDNPNRQAMDVSSVEMVAPDSLIFPGPSTGPFLRVQSLMPISTNEGYVFTNNFYTGDKTSMTPLEFMVYAVIKDRVLFGIDDFITCYLNRYSELTYREQFYGIPIYLWLIDVALTHIEPKETFMT